MMKENNGWCFAYLNHVIVPRLSHLVQFCLAGSLRHTRLVSLVFRVDHVGWNDLNILIFKELLAAHRQKVSAVRPLDNPVQLAVAVVNGNSGRVRRAAVDDDGRRAAAGECRQWASFRQVESGHVELFKHDFFQLIPLRFDVPLLRSNNVHCNQVGTQWR